MKFEKRVRALELETLENATILHFADGSTREIGGPRYFLLDLLAGTCGGNLNSDQTKQLELIRESVEAEEPGGGHMVELIQALTT